MVTHVTLTNIFCFYKKLLHVLSYNHDNGFWQESVLESGILFDNISHRKTLHVVTAYVLCA